MTGCTVKQSGKVSNWRARRLGRQEVKKVRRSEVEKIRT